MSLLNLRDMNGELIMKLSTEHSQQYDAPCVVVEGDITSNEDAAKIISYAHEIGAECSWECEPDEPADLVISFLTIDQRSGRATGPEVYTPEAVEDTVAGELYRIDAMA